MDQDIGIESTNVSINITCAEGYYLSDSGVCRPLCAPWVEPLELGSDYIAVIASVAIVLLSATIVIVLALTIQRSTMYVQCGYL